MYKVKKTKKELWKQYSSKRRRPIKKDSKESLKKPAKKYGIKMEEKTSFMMLLNGIMEDKDFVHMLLNGIMEDKDFVHDAPKWDNGRKDFVHMLLDGIMEDILPS